MFSINPSSAQYHVNIFLPDHSSNIMSLSDTVSQGSRNGQDENKIHTKMKVGKLETGLDDLFNVTCDRRV